MSSNTRFDFGHNQDEIKPTTKVIHYDSDWEIWFLDCPHCKGEIQMLKAPSTETNSGGNNSNKNNTRKVPNVPFLKVEDLTPEPKRAKILGVQTQNTGFNDAIIKCAINGRSYFLGLKQSNPNYATMFSMFGANENDWVGGEFLVGLQWNEFYEKNYVHVFDQEPIPPPIESGERDAANKSRRRK